MIRSSSLGRKSFGSSSFGGHFEPLEDRKLLTASALINEIYFDPPGSGGDVNCEYIELRGTPGMSLDNHYLILIENEDNVLHTNSTGELDMVFDLTGKTMGSDGFLILKQANSPYVVAPGTTQMTYTGKIENSGFTAMLIQNNGGPSSVPVVNQDLDVGNNGLDVPTGNANWDVLDSIGVHSEFGEAQYGRLYAPINFGPEGPTNVEPGATYIAVGYEIEYLARWGSSTGSTAADWYVANLTDDPLSGYVGPNDFRQSADPQGVGTPGQTLEANQNVPYGTIVTNTLGAPNLGPQNVDVTVGSATVAEGNSGTTSFLFTVSLSAAAGSDVTVQYATADGTATSGNDYTAVSGTLTFTPGQTSQVVTVLVNGDTTVESNETFTLNLSAASVNATILGATGIGTINNDDVANISVGNVTVAEGNAGTTPFLFTVSLSNAAASNVTVQYATANGTATSGSDYTAVSGTLTFAPGQTSKVVTVLVNGDTTIEANETFTLNLSNASGGTITGATGTGTINNDDVPSTIVGRQLFYNQSKFDGNNAAANASDDAAIAPDKIALLPDAGQATFNNITSYNKGINGIVVDIQGAHGTLTASDFTFKVGANNTPSLWASAAETPTITVRPGAGVGGSDRVEIIFTNANAPKNQWLEVVVKGNDARGGFNTNTGLAASDIFFFGNRVGDEGSGSTGFAQTTFLDESSTRTHGGVATISNIWDYDRNGLVSASDGLVARANGGNLAKINIANPPAAPEAAPAVAAPTVVVSDSGISSALAAKSLPKVEKLPTWVTDRLASLDLNGGPIGKFFTNLADNGGPRATAILKAADKLADKLGLDDSLLDDLVAGLKK